MAVEIAPRRTRKRKPTEDTLAIGEMDQTIFACPTCARPLVNGARRCPSCGTYLIIGVQARRASILVGAGLFAGLILGGGVAFGASALGGGSQGVAAGSSARPSAATSAAPSSGLPTASVGSVITSSVPALSRSALLQAATVDSRLAASSVALAGALSSSTFDTYRVSEILRGMSADAVIGLQLASHIAAWSGGKELSGEMTAFYSSIQATASDGLSVTIRNAKAYRAAGNRMQALLAGLPALDARIRDVAAQAGVVYPPPAAP